MDNNATKKVLDLLQYVNDIGHDRPPLGVFLQALSIDPKVMSDTVKIAALASRDMQDHAAIDMVNILFKLGVTIGYKYAVKKSMEEQFGRIDGGNDA